MNLGNTWKERQPIWETLNYEKDVPYSKLVRYVWSCNLSLYYWFYAVKCLWLAFGRYTLHQDQVNTNSWKYSAKELHPQYVDFPIVNPTRVGKKNRYIFTSCGSEDNMPSPVKGIMKIDVDENKSWQWFGDSDEFISEPAFAVKQSASCGKFDCISYYLHLLIISYFVRRRWRRWILGGHRYEDQLADFGCGGLRRQGHRQRSHLQTSYPNLYSIWVTW